MLLKAGRRAEGEKELALAKEMQAKSLEGSREEISEILDQAAKSTKGISAPSQIAAAIPNGSEGTVESSDNSAGEVLLIEESPLDAERASKQQKLKDTLTEILAQAFHNLGVSAAQQGQLAVSIEQFGKAAEWKPDLATLIEIGVSSVSGLASTEPLFRHFHAS